MDHNLIRYCENVFNKRLMDNNGLLLMPEGVLYIEWLEREYYRILDMLAKRHSEVTLSDETIEAIRQIAREMK